MSGVPVIEGIFSWAGLLLTAVSAFFVFFVVMGGTLPNDNSVVFLGLCGVPAIILPLVGWFIGKRLTRQEREEITAALSDVAANKYGIDTIALTSRTSPFILDTSGMSSLSPEKLSLATLARYFELYPKETDISLFNGITYGEGKKGFFLVHSDLYIYDVNGKELPRVKASV